MFQSKFKRLRFKIYKRFQAAHPKHLQIEKQFIHLANCG